MFSNAFVSSLRWTRHFAWLFGRHFTTFVCFAATFFLSLHLKCFSSFIEHIRARCYVHLLLAVNLEAWNQIEQILEKEYYTYANGKFSCRITFPIIANVICFSFLLQVQFTILVIHFGHGFIVPGSECAYPKFLSFMGVTQNLFMIILFSDFYWRAYVKKAQKIQ